MRLVNACKAIVATAALGLAVPYAHAAVISFDFTTLGSNNTQLNTTETVNNVTASGYQSGGGSFTPANLWLRNQGDDHGLGVCSEGQNSCTTGGGDINELDNNDAYEGIVLENQNGPDSMWTQLFVSSLDDNGSGGSEMGTLIWGDTLADLLGMNNRFSFEYGDFGSEVEGDILGLGQASGFNASARYLGLVAGSLDCQSPDMTVNTVVVEPPNPARGCGGTNNDYLVWKGTIDPGIDAPEPAALGLFGLALVLLGFGLRRRRSF